MAPNDPVETVYHDGKIVCILIRAAPLPDATTFYTANESHLQVGKIVYAAGSEIPRHVHRPIRRSIADTSEVLVVQKGRMILDVYADNRMFLCSREMGLGDVVVFASGGHGFRLIEDTVLIEVKQGPYHGDSEKERF